MSFNARVQSASAIRVDWNLRDQGNEDSVESVAISQSPPDGSNPTQNFVVADGTTVFTGLRPNTAYSYLLVANFSSAETGSVYQERFGTSANTPAAQSPPPPPPPPPSGPPARPVTSLRIKSLSWDSVELEYVVDWSTTRVDIFRTGPDGAVRHIDGWTEDFTGVTISSYYDSRLAFYTNYHYIVRSSTAGGRQADASIDVQTLAPPPAPVPGPPPPVADLTAIRFRGSDIVRLSWTPAPGTASIDIVRVGPDGKMPKGPLGIGPLPGTARSFVDTYPKKFGLYRYDVRSYYHDNTRAEAWVEIYIDTTLQAPALLRALADKAKEEAKKKRPIRLGRFIRGPVGSRLRRDGELADKAKEEAKKKRPIRLGRLIRGPVGSRLRRDGELADKAKEEAKKKRPIRLGQLIRGPVASRFHRDGESRPSLFRQKRRQK